MEQKIQLIFRDGDFHTNKTFLESYPDSVIGSYFLLHPNINKIDMRTSIDLEAFMKIYNFLTHKEHLSTLSQEDIDNLDTLGFSTPDCSKIQNYLYTQTNI